MGLRPRLAPVPRVAGAPPLAGVGVDGVPDGMKERSGTGYVANGEVIVAALVSRERGSTSDGFFKQERTAIAHSCSSMVEAHWVRARFVLVVVVGNKREALRKRRCFASLTVGAYETSP